MGTLDERAMQAKGDYQELESLINDYRPFILSRVLRVCEKAQDDYVEAAVLAFAEAVNAFEQGKGAFISLAQTVISRRLIDVLRKQPKNEVLFGSDVQADELLLGKAAKTAHQMRNEQMERQQEIKTLSMQLADYGFSFADLQQAAPKHENTKLICRRIISAVLQDQSITQQVIKGRVPVKELALAQGVSHKIIERHRRYIVVATVIHQGDYPFLKEYVPLDMQFSQRQEIRPEKRTENL